MKNLIIFFMLFTAVLAISMGCSKKDMNTGENQAESLKPDTTVEIKYFTVEEVQSHSSEGDCWMVIDGKVYDVTEFVAAHPGGSAILEGCGKDATELFDTRPMGSGTPHSERAREMLKKYYLGELRE
ncbi:cytochrome b5 domain-containing protein [candidate division WOR-3 bacterium]|nr:cytochrome b5 domain-containing protein [candidate division WOR-3 bacterium]